MTRYIVRRLLIFVPIMMVMSLLVFLMIDLVPGDPQLARRIATGDRLARRPAQHRTHGVEGKQPRQQIQSVRPVGQRWALPGCGAGGFPLTGRARVT